MVNESQSPLLVKDVTLMSPGNWNGWNYSADEIRKAFASKDYNTEEVNLFLDHPENPNNAASAWVGRVKNIRQMSDSTLKGDLEIFNENTIYNLKVGKAKFGVSPRIIGKENKQDMSFTDMVFDNWSIVSKPAQSTAMINLANTMAFDGMAIKTLNLEMEELAKVTAMEEKRKSMGMSPSEFYAVPKDPPSASHLPIFDEAHVRNAMARFNQVQGLSPEEKASAKRKIISAAKKYNIEMKQFMEMAQEQNINEFLEEIELSNHNYPIKGKDKEKVKGGKKKEMSEEKTEETITVSNELSDADVLSIISQDMDGFNALRRENPSLSMKDLAIKFKDRNEKLKFVEQLSENEATAMLRKLLDKIGVNELSKVPKELSQDNSMTKELAKVVENLQKEIKEIKELKSEKIPSPKTVQNLSAPEESGFSMVGNGTSEGVRQLAQEIFGMTR